MSDSSSSNNLNKTTQTSSLLLLSDVDGMMMKRRRQYYRIAMVCDFFYPNLGGVENHIWSLSQHLIRLGHKVIVITHQYNSSDDENGDEKGEVDDHRKGVRYLPGPLKVYYCPIQTMGSSINDILPTFTATLPLLRYIFIRENINIVHTHQATSTMANEAVVYAGVLGIPSVYTDHSLFSVNNDLAGVILNRVLQTSLSTLDAAICVSYTCHDNFILRTRQRRQRTSTTPTPLIRVIPNAVSPYDFTPASSSQRTTMTDGSIKERIKIVVVSRLVYRKGVDLLVGIIPIVCNKLHYVDFIIGGSGNKMLDVQEMVERERLQERVEFLGSVPHNQVRDVLIRGDVFLNCSLTESFCIAILEAASCGLLVVSTNVGGVPEVLPDDMIVLAEPNLPSLADSVFQAIERQQQQQSSSTAIDPHQTHERVKQMYSWQRVARETELVYDHVLAQPRRSFSERMSCYRSLGGISGLVVCFLALILETWYNFIEWWQPRDSIDRVPDLLVHDADIQITQPDDSGIPR